MGSIGGNAARVSDILADDINVTNLAAGLVVLAVEVDLGLWVALHDFADAVGHRHGWILFCAEDVGHDCHRSQRLSGAQRQVQHGP